MQTTSRLDYLFSGERCAAVVKQAYPDLYAWMEGEVRRGCSLQSIGEELRRGLDAAHADYQQRLLAGRALGWMYR